MTFSTTTRIELSICYDIDELIVPNVQVSSYCNFTRHQITKLYLKISFHRIVIFFRIHLRLLSLFGPRKIIPPQSLSSFFSPTCPKSQIWKKFLFIQTNSFIIFLLPESSFTCPLSCSSRNKVSIKTFRMNC
jgi:hypothetical protein